MTTQLQPPPDATIRRLSVPERYVSPANAWGLSQHGCNAAEIAEYASSPVDHPWLETIASASANPWWRPIGFES